MAGTKTEDLNWDGPLLNFVIIGAVPCSGGVQKGSADRGRWANDLGDARNLTESSSQDPEFSTPYT